MYVYEISPIDIWTGWRTEKEYFQHLLELGGSDNFSSEIRAYNDRRIEALNLALSKGWEGDFREGPYISGLPGQDGDSESEILIAWKQDNNGTTYIVSPIELPWLKGDD